MVSIDDLYVVLDTTIRTMVGNNIGPTSIEIVWRKIMAIMTKEKFDDLIKNALEKFCDKKIKDITENVDPD